MSFSKMLNKKEKDGMIIVLYKEPLNLEKYTILTVIMLIIYTSHDIGLTIIYAVFFHEKYPLLSLNESFRSIFIWGILCFAYMIFISKDRSNVQKCMDMVKNKGSIKQPV